VERMYYTPKEVAAILGISDDAVLELVNRRELPALRISPRLTRIPIAAFERWCEGYRPGRRRVIVEPARRTVVVGQDERIPQPAELTPR